MSWMAEYLKIYEMMKQFVVCAAPFEVLRRACEAHLSDSMKQTDAFKETGTVWTVWIKFETKRDRNELVGFIHVHSLETWNLQQFLHVESIM